MLDFNSRPQFHEQVGACIDDALIRERRGQPQRNYLGASSLGVACERALRRISAHPCGCRTGFPGAAAARVFEVNYALEELSSAGCGWRASAMP